MSTRSTTPTTWLPGQSESESPQLGVEALADSVDGVLEIRTHLVNLVIKQILGTPYLSALTPDFPIALHAVYGVNTPTAP